MREISAYNSSLKPSPGSEVFPPPFDLAQVYLVSHRRVLSSPTDKVY